MKTLILTSLLLSSTLFLQAQELSLEKVESIATKTSSDLDSKLKKELKKAKRANDLEGMTTFCVDESRKLIEQFNKELDSNISIKRVSLNSRNKKAEALKDEESILKAFELIQKSDAYLPKQIVQLVDENKYKVYTPIQMKSRDCKKCHGINNKVNIETKKRFTEVYKNDNGYGYKSGDVRGAYITTISSK